MIKFTVDFARPIAALSKPRVLVPPLTAIVASSLMFLSEDENQGPSFVTNAHAFMMQKAGA